MRKNTSQVLIVDDLPVNRMILSSLLASHGISSDQAEGGLQCIELCKNKNYDLILLDHRMPELDGVDTLIRLKEIFAERGKDIPVICHTTEEARKNINLYKAAGFTDVLIKPIDPAQISEVILTYLGSPESEESTENILPASRVLETVCIDDQYIENELNRLPLWLRTVSRIDLSVGIKNCGSAEDYVDALYIFRSSIDEKADDISRFLEDKDWTMYRLSVHSLKSMARLIGAKALHEMAAALEEIAGEENSAKIIQDTSHLLHEYRRFIRLLEPLMEDSEIKNLMSEASVRSKDIPQHAESVDHSRSVLFVHEVQGIVIKGIEKNLTEKGFQVISVPDKPDAIINHRFDADIIIYYPSLCDDSHIDLTMSLLGEICQDDSRILCLTGDVSDLEIAMDAKGAYRVSRTYPRPVAIDRFLEDMNRLSELLHNYHRRKTVYIVDDDADYLSVIERWLSPIYNVSCFGSAEELFTGLSALKPDLILLDYEMPQMNGFELMQSLRTNSEAQMIPIIFLTGKNDKEHVFNILQYKPDGYLLKTSTREMLLNAISRFFAETLFRMSL